MCSISYSCEFDHKVVRNYVVGGSSALGASGTTVGSMVLSGKVASVTAIGTAGGALFLSFGVALLAIAILTMALTYEPNTIIPWKDLQVAFLQYPINSDLSASVDKEKMVIYRKEGVHRTVVKVYEAASGVFCSGGMKKGRICSLNGKRTHVALQSEYLARNPAARQRLVNVTSALKNARHVAHISEIIFTNGVVEIFMPYFEGGDLAKYLKRMRPDIEVRRVLALDCIEGLSEIHAAGWAHGDVKALNVLVSKERAYWADLDLAVRQGGLWDATGTVKYFAPEQRQGCRLACNALQLADVYSLGRMLQEIFANYASPPLALLIRSMLQTDPDHRPTIAEVKQRFQAIPF